LSNTDFLAQIIDPNLKTGKFEVATSRLLKN